MEKVNTFHFQQSIPIPSSIDLDISNNFLTIQGPLGSIKVNLLQHDKKGIFYINVKNLEKKRQVSLLTNSPTASLSLRAFSQLLLEYFEGVTKGFLVHLDIVGIGYRVQQKKDLLELRLGYSHSIEYAIPNDVKIFSPKPTHICLFSIDKQRVTQIAAELRRLKLPEVYKGKGIRYKDECIQKKEGKKK